MSTPVVRVADICDQIRGVTFSGDDAVSTAQPGYLPVLRANNITETGLLLADLTFVPEARISEKQLIRAGDVVIAASSGSLSVVGKAAPALQDLQMGFGAFCKVLRPNSKVNHSYFAHFFKTRDYRQKISSLAAGANINNLRNEHLDNLQISLPSLPEQRRIAAILDQAETLRTQRRAALAQLDSLIQSLFLDMFGDARTDHERWPKVHFEEIVQESRIGLVRGSQELDDGNPYRYLRMNAITRDGNLRLEGALFAKATNEELEVYRLRRGDFLFNTRNSRELVGKTALFRSDDLYLFNNNLLRVRFTALADPEYVIAAFRTPFIQSKLELRKSGTTNVFAVYYKDLRTLPVPLPPLPLQQTFATRIQAIEALKATHRAALAQLDALFASLQQRAFQGDL